MFKRLIALLVCLTFSFSNLQYVYAKDFSVNQLPVPGTMIGESAPFAPLALKGLVVNPQKPLEFQFIIDTGSTSSTVIPAKAGIQNQEQLRIEATRLIKYFLAGLTIPEGELWVNLSPYEKNRITTQSLGQTELGRDLLAQDYILKQLTASLIYPEKDLGKEFWSRVYSKAQEQFGTTNVPVNTFNKVWILPDQAQVFENGAAAYVTKSTLKVMLDEDYLALQKYTSLRGTSEASDAAISTHSVASQIVRQIVIPEITKEVNTGKNFAPLRQIYDAMILAKWYKETFVNGILDTLYTNKNKTAGVNLTNPAVKEQIYQRYLQAYKKGVFNYIKEDPTPDGQKESRKYFSGGLNPMPNFVAINGAIADVKVDGAMVVLTVALKNQDYAMNAENLTRILKEGGVTDPQVNGDFITIYNHLQKINTKINLIRLFELYKQVVQRHEEDFKVPSGEVSLGQKIDKGNHVEAYIHFTYIGEQYDREVTDNPLIHFLKEEIHIPGVYIREKAWVESAYGGMTGRSQHYYDQYYESFIVGPKEFDALLRFCVYANEMGLPIREFLFKGRTVDAESLAKMLEEKRVAAPQVDEYFISIFNAIHRNNPNVNLKDLFELYTEVVQGHLEEFRQYSTMVSLGRIESDEHDRFGGETFDNLISDNPFLTFLREKIGIPEVYYRETAHEESLRPGTSGDYANNPDHYFTQVYEHFYVAPIEYRTILRFCVLAGEQNLRRLLSEGDNYVKPDNYRVLVESGVRVLGKDRGTGKLGNKERGFLTLDRLGFAYPPGIVLSEDLVKTIFQMSDLEKQAFVPSLLQALAQAGINVKEQRLAIRSNPKRSMPGILKTISDVDGNSHLLQWIEKVRAEWYSNEAIQYRKMEGLKDDYDMPIIIQVWKSGKSPDRDYLKKFEADPTLPLYASGVFSTRDPNTNENVLFGQYKLNGEGADLMSRGGLGKDIHEIAKIAPGVYQQLLEAKNKLEEEIDPQEVEFVVNDGKLYFLQTRQLNFSPQAEIAYINELLASKKITKTRAIPIIEGIQNKLKSRLLYKIKAGINLTPIAKTEMSTPGAFQGHLVFSEERATEYLRAGEPVVLVLNKEDKDKTQRLLQLMSKYSKFSIITNYGNASSHEAVLTRLSGIPSLINLSWDIEYNYYPVDKNRTSPELFDYLVKNDYIDKNGELQIKYYEKKDTYDEGLSNLKWGEEYKGTVNQVLWGSLAHKGKLMRFNNDYGALLVRSDDLVVIDGDKGILYKFPEENVLEEDRVVINASYGINIPKYRDQFLSEYLNADGGIKPQFTIQRLEELIRESGEKYQRFENGVDKKAAFLANLETHFLHDLLKQRQNIDKATLAENGGIDLNQIAIKRTGHVIKMQFDPAQLNQLEQGGFEGFTPVIINITHISSPLPLLGIGPRRGEEMTAKV